MKLEIIDESGNTHGPFASAMDAHHYAETKRLGNLRDADLEGGEGYIIQVVGFGAE